MLDYSVRGLYPLVPLITTESNDSYYLKGESNTYPTALVDFDGNERSSIHLRDSDLNVLHILLKQMQQGKLSPALRSAAEDAFFDTIDRHRPKWQQTLDQLGEELAALRRSIDARQKDQRPVTSQFTPAEIAAGIDEEARRSASLIAIDVEAEAAYQKYSATLTALLALRRDTFDARTIKAENILAAGAMGNPNSVYDLQNYVAGVPRGGLALDAAGRLDLDKSFTRVDYFDLLSAQRVRNNVQPSVSNRPVDFTAGRIPIAALAESLP
jgi:hypothetical protein